MGISRTNGGRNENTPIPVPIVEPIVRHSSCRSRSQTVSGRGSMDHPVIQSYMIVTYLHSMHVIHDYNLLTYRRLNISVIAGSTQVSAAFALVAFSHVPHRSASQEVQLLTPEGELSDLVSCMSERPCQNCPTALEPIRLRNASFFSSHGVKVLWHHKAASR